MWLGRSWWRRRSTGPGRRIWGPVGDASSRSLGEEAIGDGGLATEMGAGDRRRVTERHSRSVPQTLGRSRHGVAAARERDGVMGGVDVRVMIFDVIYILCLLGWTKFGIGLFWVPHGLGAALLHCIFLYF
jgi:hypothetical protein